MAKRKKILSDHLRALIEESEHTRYSIAQETGVDAAVLCHFVAGRRGVSMDSLDALGKFLDLELVYRSTKRKG